jgi:hypothetical protein
MVTWRGGGQFYRGPRNKSDGLRWLRRLAIAVLITGILIVLIDLNAVVIRHGVYDKFDSWWGARELAAPGADTPFRPASAELVLRIGHGNLVATYHVTGPAGRGLIAQALDGQRAETGNFLVNELGRISIAQFRYGLWGDGHYWSPVLFRPPYVRVSRGLVNMVVSSRPFRLQLDQQYLYIAPPDPQSAALTETIQVKDAGPFQLINLSGAQRTSVTNKNGMLLRRDSDAPATAIVREPGQAWAAGLRAVGGIYVPVAGQLVLRLAAIFIYLVLLGGLSRASRDLPAIRILAVSRNAVLIITGGFAALAVLSSCYAVIYELAYKTVADAPALAGPLGLLMAGIAVLWPAACWRVRPADPRPRPEPVRAQQPRRHARPLAGMAAVAVSYLVVLHAWLGISQVGTGLLVLTITAATGLVSYPLAGIVLRRDDRADPMPALVPAGLFAVALAATVAWPVLLYSGFRFAKNGDLFVNVIGKWTYLVAGLIVVAGLCVLAARVIGTGPGRWAERLAPDWPGRRQPAATTPGRRAGSWLRWQLLGTVQWLRQPAIVAVAAVLIAAIGPALIGQAQVWHAHGPGLVPSNIMFFDGLYRALPQLLNWLLLGLAIAVLLSIARAPSELGGPDAAADRQKAIRAIAVPVIMLLLYGTYGGYSWLYLPVTLIAGLIIVAVLILPGDLADRRRRGLAPGAAIRLALGSWRSADFAAAQQESLASSGDDIRAALLNKGMTSFTGTYRSIDSAQRELARQHDQLQQRAHAFMDAAFDHRGELPDSRRAWHGAVTGALLGIVPAAVLLLKAQPAPSWSGYPVLDFLGSTGWTLFLWPVLGWSIGFFLPLIRGQDGIRKALWLFTGAAAFLPINLLWYDRSEWQTALIFNLELFSFLLIATVILGDLMTLRAAGMRVSAWVQVHNWRFIVTWSTAVIAATGTAAVTFLTTAATDIGHQTLTELVGPVTPPNRTP